MRAVSRLVLIALLWLAGERGAFAQHSHHAHGTPASTSSYGVGLTAIAAHYETPSFVGNYQGLAASLHWAADRFGVSVGLPAYRLEKNGARYTGLGDLVLHGQAMVLGAHPRHLGIALAVSAPTGSQRDGLGMGHVMVMPALWGTWAFGDVAVHASAGYGRAFGDREGHAHGGAPLVDPMNFSELTYSASADLGLARQLRVGARLGGAVALDDDGVDRLIGAVRVVLTEGGTEVAAEVQTGIAGDPFTVRGLVEAVRRF